MARRSARRDPAPGLAHAAALSRVVEDLPRAATTRYGVVGRVHERSLDAILRQDWNLRESGSRQRAVQRLIASSSTHADGRPVAGHAEHLRPRSFGERCRSGVRRTARQGAVPPRYRIRTSPARPSPTTTKQDVAALALKMQCAWIIVPRPLVDRREDDGLALASDPAPARLQGGGGSHRSRSDHVVGVWVVQAQQLRSRPGSRGSSRRPARSRLASSTRPGCPSRWSAGRRCRRSRRPRRRWARCDRGPGTAGCTAHARHRRRQRRSFRAAGGRPGQHRVQRLGVTPTAARTHRTFHSPRSFSSVASTAWRRPRGACRRITVAAAVTSSPRAQGWASPMTCSVIPPRNR